MTFYIYVIEGSKAILNASITMTIKYSFTIFIILISKSVCLYGISLLINEAVSRHVGTADATSKQHDVDGGSGYGILESGLSLFRGTGRTREQQDPFLATG